uniref:Uncharacterized protein n=1 Tax=Eiseniibacteriota bacterium TaxID=2212470 RepID=A0A832MLC2_UNCEI
MPIANALATVQSTLNNLGNVHVADDAAIAGSKLDLTSGTGAITNVGNVTTTGDYDVSGKVDAGGGFYDDGAKFAEGVSTNLWRIYARDGSNAIEIANDQITFSDYAIMARVTDGVLPSGAEGMVLLWKNAGGTAHRWYFYINGGWRNAGPD